MNKLKICLTPALLPLFRLSGCVVVVVDVLRATSSFVVGLDEGRLTKILPLMDLETCLSKRQLGYLVAAERDGAVVEGFDFGNSPFSYQQAHLAGRDLAVTTTNGTKTIHLSASADEIVVGCLLNLSAVVAYLAGRGKDVVVACAGWKDHFNLEDTLCAGALVWHLQQSGGFEFANDECLVASMVYGQAIREGLFNFVKKSAHFARLAAFGIEADIRFCMQENYSAVVPVYRDGFLVKA